jgi:hypothetical protein
MASLDLISLDQAELERRRALHKLRSTREIQRKELLENLLQAQHRAAQLRHCVSRFTESRETTEDSDLGRMLGWIRAELQSVEDSITPSRIAHGLRQSNLFPEHDALADPAGDPPAKLPWGR